MDFQDCKYNIKILLQGQFKERKLLSSTESSSEEEPERLPSEPTPESREETIEEIETPKAITPIKTPEEQSSEEDDFDIPAMAVYVDDKHDNIQDIVKEETKS